jgi:hypothetical protein
MCQWLIITLAVCMIMLTVLPMCACVVIQITSAFAEQCQSLKTDSAQLSLILQSDSICSINKKHKTARGTATAQSICTAVDSTTTTTDKRMLAP